ncbi:hypothetical protein ACFYY3_15445 [Streptomyces sp. NPDC001812]|uniref:SCO2400 family protein n=1 Tax=Streptomyces sp. NPDC001812 TaxID=3364611 RepID=UPI0036C6ED25
MDYCSTCRRHLNGALVCPGCGAYAPDIAPSVMGGRTVPGPSTTTAPPGTEATGGTRGTERVDTGAGTLPDADLASTDADAEVGPAAEPASASASAMSAPTGRAARRRQLARWKKTQRRALVATAVALVGGGLTVASMDRGSGDRTQAATAPEVTGMGGVKEPAGPAEQYGDPAPAATPPGTHRPSPDRPAQPASDDAPDPRSTDTASAPGSTSDTRPDGATGAPTTAPPPPRTASGAEAGSGSGSVSGAGSAEGPGAATRPANPPAEASGSGGGNSGNGGDGRNKEPMDRGGSQPAAPDPSTPPPDSPSTPRSELCLLVICLG